MVAVERSSEQVEIHCIAFRASAEFLLYKYVLSTLIIPDTESLVCLHDTRISATSDDIK